MVISPWNSKGRAEAGRFTKAGRINKAGGNNFAPSISSARLVFPGCCSKGVFLNL